MHYFRIGIVALAVLCLGAAKKSGSIDLRVHGLGTEDEVPTFAVPAVLLNGRPVFLQRMPLLTDREVVGISPFPADNGTFGLYFKVNNHGTELLKQHTMSKQGDTLVVMLNGVQVANLVVDRPVSDGIFRIPRGLVEQDIANLSQVFPVMGESKSKRKKR